MPTECSQDSLDFASLGSRKVTAAFDGGAMTSNAGALLLRETDRAIRLSRQAAACFTDGRRQDRIEHSVETLLAQRIHGIALGYEDLNDHDELRHDPVLGLLSGKLEARRATCSVLAGKSTLNRLEHAPKTDDDRYRKLSVDEGAMKRLFVSVFLKAHATPPKRIILDLDATDDPIHGDQEGRFFHGYYKCYCYLPLYIFCGRDLLLSKLRPANIDASAGAKEEIAFIVAQIRDSWPNVDIWLRADSGFCREEMMAWCEAHGVHYVFGLARNERLEALIADELAEASAKARDSGKPERIFKELRYQTLKSWSRERRVVAKAEHLPKGKNPRFIVSSLTCEAIEAKELYEKIYCARGDMENRIKECQPARCCCPARREIGSAQPHRQVRRLPSKRAAGGNVLHVRFPSAPAFRCRPGWPCGCRCHSKNCRLMGKLNESHPQRSGQSRSRTILSLPGDHEPAA